MFAVLLLAGILTIMFTIVTPGAYGADSDLQWGDELVMFAPLDRSHPVVDDADLATMPEGMDIEAAPEFPSLTLEPKHVSWEAGRSIDLEPYIGESSEDSAYVFAKLHSPAHQTVTLGIGADWWIQCWMNGRPFFDTLEMGNRTGRYSILDHQVEVELQKGKNVLAMRFIRGRATALLAIGDESMFAAALRRQQASDADVLTPPQIISASDTEYPTVETRNIQMVSSMAVSPRGRLWAVWYAGPAPGEDRNNYVVVATSGDDGRTWEERLVIDPDGSGPIRAFDPQIWVDPDGRLWVFWGQAVAHGKNAQSWAMTTADADAGQPVWNPPRHVAQGVMMCKPIVLSNGKWIFPISDWAARLSGDRDAASAAVYIAVDQGESFELRGKALVPLEDRQYDEHMLVERKNGDLWMLVRTRYGIGESVSSDGGRTWPVVSPSSIKHPNARFFITRLNSGNLLLVKHGPIDRRIGRSHLQAFISKDDGLTWDGGFLLDERGGISYPDGQQTEDGMIYITYDYSRRNERAIYMTSFMEEDAAAGEAVSGRARLRESISTPGPVSVDLNSNDDGVSLNQTAAAQIEPDDGGQTATLKIGAKIWSDREYVFSVIPEELEAKHFIRSPIGRSRGLVVQAGYVYVIAPDKAIADDLLDKGFEKTDIPQFIPFTVSGSYKIDDACSVYQKRVELGDRVDYGKWGITVFSDSVE